MSQQPPPPPYGGPPRPDPPGPYPQGPSGAPPSGLSNKAKFWIGVALTIPALFLAGVVTAAPSAVLDSLNADPTLSGVVGFGLLLMMFVLFIVAIVMERTRWFALGILAGTAVLFVLAAGACVALLVAYSNSYG